ncbi:MAG: transposase [Conexivisphaera sp.]
MRRNGREKMRLRSTIVEHPFGTMKRAMNQGYSYFPMRGLRKVAAEFGLSVIAYNMKRAISVMGAVALRRALAWRP